MEDKIDKLSEAVVYMARIEERIIRSLKGWKVWKVSTRSLMTE